MHAAMICVGVFFVAVAVMVLVGIAGLVLLIVGLVTRRKALWGSGIAAVLLSFIAGGVTIGLGVRYMILSASEAVFSSVAVSDSSFFVSVSDEEMRNWFSDNADVELPDEVVLLNGLSHTILPTSTYYMKISAPEEFGTFLEEHFSTDTWSGVEAHFNLSRLDEEEKASLPFWNLSEIKQCSFFFQVSSGIA
ncbi:MAG: hypothetical protein SVV80_02525 [Planctomycetota bacterium]|nr:hypothetical protein [Planctomycetota bacterium]